MKLIATDTYNFELLIKNGYTYVDKTVLAIICGFTRYVHINRLRKDIVLATLL